MTRINLDGKRFRSRSNSASGDVGPQTEFQYRQNGDLVWAFYSGGSVARGQLIAVMDADGRLDMRYQHTDIHGAVKTGVCLSSPEYQSDGCLLFHEQWRWTCDDHGSGASIIESL